jgi:hypothetical protein
MQLFSLIFLIKTFRLVELKKREAREALENAKTVNQPNEI